MHTNDQVRRWETTLAWSIFCVCLTLWLSMVIAQTRSLVGFRLSPHAINPNVSAQSLSILKIYTNNCLAYFFGLALVLLDLKNLFRLYIFFNIVAIAFVFSFFIFDISVIVKPAFYLWNLSFWNLEFVAYIHALNWRKETAWLNMIQSLAILLIAAFIESQMPIRPW